MKGYCCGAVSNYVAALWEVVIPVLKASDMGKDQVYKSPGWYRCREGLTSRYTGQR